MFDEYTVVDAFLIKDQQVLVLDREFNIGKRYKGIVEIAGKSFKYQLNSVRNWVTIPNTESFKGMTAIFAVD